MSRPARRAACSTSWEGVGQPSLTVVCMWRSARPQRGIGVHPNPAGLTIDLLDAAPGHLLLGGWAVEGLMQDYELSLQHVLWRLERLHQKKEVVTKQEQGLHCTTNGEIVRRVNRLAGALKRIGVKPGDRVATLAWNNYRHLELYYAVPCMGAVLQTLNLGLTEKDTVLPIVPMFHANSWGLPYACGMAGSKVLFPDRFMGDAKSIVDLAEEEGATILAGVPTIWINTAAYLKESGRRLPRVKSVICGGSAIPRAVMEAMGSLGLRKLPAWGLTETSPP